MLGLDTQWLKTGPVPASPGNQLFVAAPLSQPRTKAPLHQLISAGCIRPRTPNETVNPSGGSWLECGCIFVAESAGRETLFLFDGFSSYISSVPHKLRFPPVRGTCQLTQFSLLRSVCHISLMSCVRLAKLLGYS